MNHTRALAAEVLAAVALEGASLRGRLQPAQATLGDARDRALLTALCHEGTRWWLRFDRALDGLLQRPLRDREPRVHAVLVLGLVQIECLRLPAHVAVSTSVEATRALGRGGFAKLVNAILRRWLRERDARSRGLDADPVTRTAHPAWLVDALRQDWPDAADALLATNNVPAPPMLRVNPRRAARTAVIGELATAGIQAAAHPHLRDALVLAAHANVAHLPGFAAGHFSVQDGAAQIAADLLDLHAGLRVLDACAAPGGKTCHLLERADVDVLALEREPERTRAIDANLRRLGLSCRMRSADAGDPAAWWDGTPFDRILLDAPCSATGVIRRHPDIKLHRRASDIARLAQEQARLLAALWPLLAPGGRLLYATCSVLHAENQRVIAAFADDHPEARTEPVALPMGRQADLGCQILPGDAGLDGMYHAVLTKGRADQPADPRSVKPMPTTFIPSSGADGPS